MGARYSRGKKAGLDDGQHMESEEKEMSRELKGF